MKFSKQDFWYSLITGAYTGAIVAAIADFLRLESPAGISFAWLVIIVPLLWITGIRLGYFLGNFLAFFNQFGKFAAIGFTNASVDFGLLNLLIWGTGIAAGPWYAVFKTISFTIGSIHSYAWNKYWVFEAAGNQAAASEFAKFFSVAVAAAIVNVAVASAIVNLVPALAGVSPEAWANIGAIVGSAIALVVSFVGFRVVFKK